MHAAAARISGVGKSPGLAARSRALRGMGTAVMALALISGSPAAAASAPERLPSTDVADENHAKKRLFVLTDIEADPDDAQSLIRLLLYSNDIDIEGLAATTSAPQPDLVAPETIHAIIDQYAKVQPNLVLHDRDYPTAEALRAIVRQGVPLYGMKGVGDGHSSTASQALIRALERPDPRPLWVSVWGGPNVLAQALFTIRATRTPQQAEALYRKLRVYTISDQDDSGPWIRRNFPSIFYIVTPWSWGRATWMGMANRLPHSDLDIVSDAWIAQNIQQGHGPLGAAYPDVAYGMEGDTPSFLGLIPNGLNEMEHPDWGGWGGRYEHYTPVLSSDIEAGALGPNEPETRPIWTNAEDTYAPPSAEPLPVGPPGPPMPKRPAFEVKDNYVTLWRWRSAYQNDFAARMDWTTKAYRESNHAPVVRLNGPAAFTVRSGQTFDLDAASTTDPDGDSLSFFWFQYREAGSYPGAVSFGYLSPKLNIIRKIQAPVVSRPETVHFIVAVTDKGTPPLTRYKRVIVTILPDEKNK